MERNQILKQATKIQMAYVNLGMDALSMIQNQSEMLANAYLDQTDRAAKTGKQLYGDWVKNSKKGREELKKTVDSSYKMFEGILGL